jgi:hypothetical protein
VKKSQLIATGIPEAQFPALPIIKRCSWQINDYIGADSTEAITAIANIICPSTGYLTWAMVEFLRYAVLF